MNEWITTEQAAEHLSVSKLYLIRLRTHGGGPRFAKLAGGRIVRYKRSWLDEWMEAQAHNATCEYMVTTAS